MIKDKHYYKDLILQSFEDQEEKLIETWNNGNPSITKYFCVDNLLPEDDAMEIYKEFLKESKNWVFHKSLFERKSTLKKIDSLGKVIPSITDSFHCQEVIDVIENITGIDGLEADPSLYAGGMSLMKKGDFLSPHIDNSHDQKKLRYRRLNLLYYVSPNWLSENGGNLELWDKKVKFPCEIVSSFNRLVIMRTNDLSYHSVNKVKVDQPRCCVSNYYFSKNSEKGYDYQHVTSAGAWPGQYFLRALGRIHTASRGFIARTTGKTRRGVIRKE
jgi:Rps23 Pro-64 3,4-dihydroxylase Tpa1-like proline 4-hydroxylase